MSAYMVDRHHIRYLVEASMPHAPGLHRPGCGSPMRWYWNWQPNGSPGNSREAREDNAALIGQMLWNANRKSIEYRYPDTATDFSRAPGPIDEAYVYDIHETAPLMFRFDPWQVIRSCDCFAYQACEHPGWRESEAKAFIDRLKERALGKLERIQEENGPKLAWGAPRMPEREKNPPVSILSLMGERK